MLVSATAILSPSILGVYHNMSHPLTNLWMPAVEGTMAGRVEDDEEEEEVEDYGEEDMDETHKVLVMDLQRNPIPFGVIPFGIWGILGK